MNKNELISAMAEESGLTKVDTVKALEAFINQVIATLKKEEKVQLVGFGSFEVRHRAARVARNPRTKQPVAIPAGKAPCFKAGKVFKESI